MTREATTDESGEQLALVRGRSPRRPRPPVASAGVAADRPVAQVAVDVSLPHLDRPFDYLVPAHLDADAVEGCRVRVRFAGKLVGGYLLGRSEHSEREGRLASLDRVLSAEPVLAPEILKLARAVADRYCGTLADVLRLAVPPRHARAEVAPTPEPPPLPTVPKPGAWADYPAGQAFVQALAAGGSPRAVWTALPGPSWPRALAVAVRATLASGRGALLVLADGAEVRRLDAALRDELGPGQHVALTAEAGPEARYRRWLQVRRGAVRAVVGTRAAMFAPVRALGLVAIWDDGDDVHAEPHAPYPHAREVLAMRAYLEKAAFLTGGFSRTTEGAQLVASGWARPVTAERPTVRAAAPLVGVAGDDAELARDAAARSARLPTVAWRRAKEALARGPVLVQVPRRGYLPALACRWCREPARCPDCRGPLALAGHAAAAACRWCGRIAASWSCPGCGGTAFRASAVGVRRTAEELGRAFPGVPVRTSGRDGVLATVGADPALVVATPGAEPVAEGGFAAALLLDGWALLSRPDLRAGEEALRRWMAAAALVRPAAQGGSVVLLADSDVPAAQALVRWDPVTFADRELAERDALGFPPAVLMASLTGAPDALADFLAVAELPGSADVLGPVEVRAPDGAERVERALVRVPRGHGAALVSSLRAAQGVRSARKAPGAVRVQVDPHEIA